MKFLERSYGGKIFRPRPKIEFNPEHKYLLVATPWGTVASADRVISSIRDYYLSARSDIESTSPFEKQTCLSPMANDLRIGVKLANDAIYNEDNREEYQAGFELFSLVSDGTEVSWTQLGMPAVFLDRPNSPLIPLGGTQDLSTEFSPASHSFPPLPSKLLGLENTTDFEMHTHRLNKGESLILLSRSFIPQGFFELSFGERNLETISKVCANDNEGLPFWAGVLNF